MSSSLVLSVEDAAVSFGKTPLFEGLSFNIHRGDKISLVGKNGAGKTTLMKIISGDKELDSGTRWQEKGLVIGYLKQEAKADYPEQNVYDFVYSGLSKDKQTEEYTYMVQMVIEPFGLNAEDKLENLSGGQLRRCAIARSLIEEPDILLLDEPTNHLDLEAIKWMEDYLKSYRGTVLCISHDKTFLANMSDKVFWLDRSNIRVCPKGFGHFEEWSQMLLEQEERELIKRQKIVNMEVEWASKGIKARRKRNIRRLEEMKEARENLKKDKSLFNQATSKLEIKEISDATRDSKIVVEFFNVNKSYNNDAGEKIILDRFNFKVMKGDRIGILGKNGSGKTSFLKLVTGQMKPDMGKVKISKNADISYFDQKREGLKLDESLWRNLSPEGGDYVNVGGKQRHVCGYLKDFMFDPKQARDLVSTLSGGQKNRLMLSKVLAYPGNFMILDEPTNDLDMDTLDMLEEILSKYTGTLFVVSHDRDFLDQTVTQTLAFEGNGVVNSYLGGYSDYLQELEKNSGETQKPEKKQTKSEAKNRENSKQNKAKSAKLTYKHKFELDNLPKKIKQLEKDILELKDIISDSNLYMQDPEKFDKTVKAIDTKQTELEQSEEKWLNLLELEESLS